MPPTPTSPSRPTSTENYRPANGLRYRNSVAQVKTNNACNCFPEKYYASSNDKS